MFVVAAGTLFAGDWPQWLGPQRDGVSAETVVASWPKDGPPRLWQRDVGAGYSGTVIAGERLILFHRVDDKEVVECLHPATGKNVWRFDYPSNYEDNFGKGNGPRSTPLIHGKRVITLGPSGDLHCLDIESGKKVWHRELLRDYQVPDSFFGVGTSPVVEKDLVLINVGGKDAGIVAFALDTGKEVWKATQDHASYSSPMVTTIDGVRQAIFFTRTGVVTLDAKTGQVIYQKRWRARIEASVNAATPLIVGKLAFFSTSYDTGALLVKLRKDGADEVWSGDDIMSNHYNTCVHHQGYLYGFEGRQEAGPSLRCIELKTGKVQWTKERFGCGSMILAGSNLLMLTEAGNLILAEANPQEYREKARARVFEAPPCRAQLALADGRLFARDQRKLVCFDVKK
jgi:outer membrane protein assembly factor BamB